MDIVVGCFFFLRFFDPKAFSTLVGPFSAKKLRFPNTLILLRFNRVPKNIRSPKMDGASGAGAHTRKKGYQGYQGQKDTAKLVVSASIFTLGAPFSKEIGQIRIQNFLRGWRFLDFLPYLGNRSIPARSRIKSYPGPH